MAVAAWAHSKFYGQQGLVDIKYLQQMTISSEKQYDLKNTCQLPLDIFFMLVEYTHGLKWPGGENGE